jgi:hypothetical protein
MSVGPAVGFGLDLGPCDEFAGGQTQGFATISVEAAMRRNVRRDICCSAQCAR